jgi:hypothetical protein
MSPDDTTKGPPETHDQRLRIDAGKVDIVRMRLAAVDRTVFGAAPRHASDDHDRRLAETVAGLLDNG